MTGYKSKKAAAQDKLTQWLEALHHSQEPESVDAQPADPTGQAPCVRHCESTAYEIVIRGLKGDIERMKAAQRKPLTDVTIKEWAERHDINGVMTDLRCMAEDAETLYLLAEEKNTPAQPAQRQWVDLTDEDEIDWDGGNLKSLIKAIEAKLKEKNT